MDLRSLRHVVALAHHLHFRKAAEAVGLTQPALSKSIQLAEQRYGVPLFDRNRRAVSLTAMGRVFVEHAEQLLRKAADFELQIGRAASGLEGQVTFGMAPSTSRTSLPSLMHQLASERPGLRINVAVRRASVLVSMLLDEEIEFVVCARSQMPQSANVAFRSFGFHSAVCLVRPGHPLLTDATLDIADFPVVAAGPIDGKSDELYRGLVETYRYQPRMTIESVEVLARFTQASDAIWLSSTFAAANEILDGSLIVLETPEVTARGSIEIGLFTLRNKITSSPVQNIAQRLKAIFDRGLMR